MDFGNSSILHVGCV